MIDGTVLVYVPRPGVEADEFQAQCGSCRNILPRLAAFNSSDVDYIACLCGQENVLRRPR